MKPNNPTHNQRMLLKRLSPAKTVPEPNKYYTFIYQAKTPGIEYDQHPLVGVTDIFNWGFRGINFHWDKIRNYTWQEIPGQLHIVRQSEIQTMLDIPYTYYLTK